MKNFSNFAADITYIPFGKARLALSRQANSKLYIEGGLLSLLLLSEALNCLSLYRLLEFRTTKLLTSI